MGIPIKISRIIAVLITVWGGNQAMAQYPVSYQQDGKWGYQNAETKRVLITDLTAIKPFQSGVGIVEKDGQWGAVNAQMEMVLPYEYDEILVLATNVIRAKQKDHYHLVDSTGHSIVKGDLLDVARLKETDHLVIRNSKGQSLVVDQQGNRVIKSKYAGTPAHLIGTDLAVLKPKGKAFYQGVINEKGKPIVPFKYLFIDVHNQTYYRCEDFDQQVDYYDRAGNLLVTAASEDIYFFNSEVISKDVSEDQDALIFLKSGQQFLAQEWRRLESLYYGYLAEQTIFISPTGKIDTLEGRWYVTGAQYDQFLIQSNTGSIIMDSAWNEVITFKNRRVFDWNTNWAIVQEVQNSTKMVLVDLKTGEPVVDQAFDLIDFLPCQRVALKSGDEVLVLNQALESINQIQGAASAYYLLSSHKRKQLRQELIHKASMQKDVMLTNNATDCQTVMVYPHSIKRSEVILDPYGNKALPNRIVIKVEDRMGIVDVNGQVILPLYYNIISSYNGNGYIPVAINETQSDGTVQRVWGVINADGKALLKPQFTKVGSNSG